MSVPKVSVVLPVRNSEQFLAQAIESILGQSFSDFELLLVDNGSTDGTAAILAEFARRDARVRTIRCERVGAASAANAGMAVARGIYLARMDADDIARCDRLARQVSFLDQHPAVAVVGGALNLIDEAGAPLSDSSQSAYATSDREIRTQLASGCPVAQPAVMMRAQAVREVGGYREPFIVAEDYDLWLRLAERWQFANLSEVVLDYRVHPRQLSSTAIRQQALCSLAARLAADKRRATQVDPIDGIGAITPKFLEQFGIPQGQLQCETARRCLIRARFALANGWLDQGLDMVALAEQEALDPEARRVMLPEIRLLRARLRLRKKQTCAGLGALLQSFAAAPLQMIRRAWMAARRKVVRIYFQRAA